MVYIPYTCASIPKQHVNRADALQMDPKINDSGKQVISIFSNNKNGVAGLSMTDYLACLIRFTDIKY